MKSMPTMSRQGYVNTLPEIADRLMSYFFTTAYSQSYLYAGMLTSLPQLIQAHGDDERVLNDRVQEALTKYLTRYFSYVLVTVTRVIDPSVPTGEIQIQLAIKISHDGEKHNFGKLISVVDNSIKRITEITNG